MELSIVSPVYKAEKILPELVKRIHEAVKPLGVEYEIVLVEDGSPDNSWRVLEGICKNDLIVKGIKLSRNFGQHYAITAGLACAKGNYIVVMDCDLQDDPKHIPQLYAKAKEGFEIVYTKNNKRQHSAFKNITSKIFNRLIIYLTDDSDYESFYNVGAYSIITRKVADSFNSFNDYHRHYLMVLRWLGYSHTYLEVEHQKRFEGKSSYNFRKLFRHAINGIVSQSDKILRMFVYLGLMISVLAFLGILVIIFLYFQHGFMPGWASMFVLMLFSLGIILTCLGIVGIYVGKTFEQSKGRPKFIIEKEVNR